MQFTEKPGVLFMLLYYIEKNYIARVSPLMVMLTTRPISMVESQSEYIVTTPSA